jgi:biopolymer transport protein ExbD
MSNSTMAAPRPAAQKATKEERRKKKQRQFIAMTAIVFVILFIFSMCITVIAASIGAVDATNGEIETNSSTPDSGKPGIVHLSTYDEAETQQETTEDTTDATENTTENTTEAETEATEPVTEETTEPTEEVKKYTEDDLFYLAAAVCREAGGESEEIQLLVANVIINRVNSSIYPDTIYEVLTEYKQYGTMWKYGVSFPDWADDKVKEQCYSVAKRILEGERFCPENVLFQAEFKQGSGVYKQFGDDYYFCYYG